MIDYVSNNTAENTPLTVVETISQINPAVAITLGALACFTIVFCISSVIFSGCDMTLSSNGLLIKQPIKSE